MNQSSQKKNASNPTDEVLYEFEQQDITLTRIPYPGRILDLGGGGEGTIGKLEGERVVAIAPMYPERFVAEAAVGSLKILMDACDLKFLEGTFPLVTSFFTLMYIPGEDHEKVFAEVFRVLLPGGRFYLWEASVPECLDETTAYYVLSLRLHLPECEINTGYGQPWPGETRDLAYYRSLAARTGFEVIGASENRRVLAMEMQKPALVG